MSSALFPCFNSGQLHAYSAWANIFQQALIGCQWHSTRHRRSIFRWRSARTRAGCLLELRWWWPNDFEGSLQEFPQGCLIGGLSPGEAQQFSPFGNGAIHAELFPHQSRIYRLTLWGNRSCRGTALQSITAHRNRGQPLNTRGFHISNACAIGIAR